MADQNIPAPPSGTAIPIAQAGAIPPPPSGMAVPVQGTTVPNSGTASEPGLLDKLATPPSQEDFQRAMQEGGIAPTVYGLKNVVSGVAQGVKGAIDTFNPNAQPGENALTQSPGARILKGLYNTGKQAAQIPGAIHDINQSADPTGAYLQAAGDISGQAGGQVAAAAATEGARIGAGKLKGAFPTEAAQAAKVKAVVPEAATLPPRAIAGVEDIIDAAAPTGKNTSFRANAYVAAGDLAEIARKTALDEAKGGIVSPDMRPRATVNAINEHLSDMYRTEVEPQIATSKQAPIKLSLNADASGGIDYMAKNGGEAATRVIAEKIRNGQPVTLHETYELARKVNAELSSYESATPEAKAANEATSKNTAGLKQLDRTLSDSIDNELSAQGKPGIKNFERRYAALSSIRDQLQVRVNSAELSRPGVIRAAGKAVGSVFGGPKAIASASQAAVADVKPGLSLQRGFQKLASSGINATRGSARPAAPFNLTSPGQAPPPTQGTLPFPGLQQGLTGKVTQ